MKKNIIRNFAIVLSFSILTSFMNNQTKIKYDKQYLEPLYYPAEFNSLNYIELETINIQNNRVTLFRPRGWENESGDFF